MSIVGTYRILKTVAPNALANKSVTAETKEPQYKGRVCNIKPFNQEAEGEMYSMQVR